MNFPNSFFKWFRVFQKQWTFYRCLNSATKENHNSSYIFKNEGKPLVNTLIDDLLDRAADSYGDHTAFVSEQQGISKNCYELRNEAEKLASGLIACGLQKGDRIAVYCPSCYEWPLMQFAAAKAGLIVVAINHASKSQELEYCLKKAECKAVVSYDKLKHQDFYEVFNNLIPNLRKCDRMKIQTTKLPSLEKIIMISDDIQEGTIRFRDIFEFRNNDSDALLSKIKKTSDFDDPTNILFTSGTTGSAKAVVLTNHKIVNNVSRLFIRLGYDKMEPVICSPLPFFHTFGCLFTTLGIAFHKTTTILPSASYDSTEYLKCIDKYRCNATYGTPTMLIDLLTKSRDLQLNINSIKTIVTGGTLIPENLIKNLYLTLKNPNIHLAYGLTETCGGLSFSRSGIDCETLMKGFVEPCDQTELKIIDRRGQVVPKNMEGEICGRGYSIFREYWNDKDKTAGAIDKNNWFQTGDIGVINNKGWLKVAGRIKDILIRGGENINLSEIENFLSTHPEILDACACSIPDERLGEEMCCWIRIKPGTIIAEEDIREFCRKKMSHYKIPRYILFEDEFPKTSTGKIKRFEMTEISKKKLNL